MDAEASTKSVALINFFEVPKGVNKEFIEAWERTQDLLKKQEGFEATALHRSLGPQARFRFVNIGSWASAQAFTAATQQPEFKKLSFPYKSTPALFEMLQQDRPEWNDQDAIVLINPVLVPEDAHADFQEKWDKARGFLSEQPGYRATRLFRSLKPVSRIRFVNVSLWNNAESFRAAKNLAQATKAIELPYRSAPALYQIVRR